jgi:hypothetical protein
MTTKSEASYRARKSSDGCSGIKRSPGKNREATTPCSGSTSSTTEP